MIADGKGVIRGNLQSQVGSASSLPGALVEDGALVTRGDGGWGFALVHKNNFAGFGNGVAVEGKTAMGYQVLHDVLGFRSPPSLRADGGGIGFAIGQAVTQVSLAVALDLPRCLRSGKTAHENPSPFPQTNSPRPHGTSESALRSLR